MNLYKKEVILRVKRGRLGSWSLRINIHIPTDRGTCSGDLFPVWIAEWVLNLFQESGIHVEIVPKWFPEIRVWPFGLQGNGHSKQGNGTVNDYMPKRPVILKKSGPGLRLKKMF